MGTHSDRKAPPFHAPPPTPARRGGRRTRLGGGRGAPTASGPRSEGPGGAARPGPERDIQATAPQIHDLRLWVPGLPLPYAIPPLIFEPGAAAPQRRRRPRVWAVGGGPGSPRGIPYGGGSQPRIIYKYNLTYKEMKIIHKKVNKIKKLQTLRQKLILTPRDMVKICVRPILRVPGGRLENS